MSGLRSFGQVLNAHEDRGDMAPEESRINFAVPAVNNLYGDDDQIKPIYPGICIDHIKTLSKVMSGKPLKICVDGKKISSSKGKTVGDIDCWGYEGKPTLEEKKNISRKHIDDVNEIQSNLDNIIESGINDIEQLSTLDKTDLVQKFLEQMKTLAGYNKLLREKAETLERIETKLKAVGGKSWTTSRYYPAICSIRCSRTAIKTHVEDSIKLTNKLAFYSATMNNKQSEFQNSDTVVMEDQSNYNPLNENFQTDNTRYVKQRTDKWFNIRKEAMVTGSTCYDALGLGKLKKQQKHYDYVITKKAKPEFSKDVLERMEYGTAHENDAVATVCGKVIPAIYPKLKMFEEGCIRIGHNGMDSFMVVSPDGSLRTDMNERTSLAYENKCKAPTSYVKTAYYSIPVYYVPQILSEMNACECDRLLFTCWSEESTTVFEVTNDEILWQKCWTELTRVYGCEIKARPKHFSQTSKELKEEIKLFIENKTSLLGEFPSMRMIYSQTNVQIQNSTMQPYKEPNNHLQHNVKQIPLTSIEDLVEGLKRWLTEVYEHLRSVASEILVFMLTDLDRIYDMESSNSHIVAYALKGPSMKNEILRNMTRDVIAACENQNLNVCVTSSDGQWHLYGVLDDKQRPLTVHQLHRQLWNRLRSMPKSKLQTMLRRHCFVKSIDDVQFEKIRGKLSLLGHKHEKMIDLSASNHGQLTSCVADETNLTDNVEETDVNTNEIEYFGCLAGDSEQMIGPETIDAIDRAADAEQLLDNKVEYTVSYDILHEATDTVLLDLDIQLHEDFTTQVTSYEDDKQIAQSAQSSEHFNPELDNSTKLDFCETSVLLGEASRVLNQDDMYDFDSSVRMDANQTESIEFKAGRIFNVHDMCEFDFSVGLNTYQIDSLGYEVMSAQATSSGDIPVSVITAPSCDTPSHIDKQFDSANNMTNSMRSSSLSIDLTEKQVQSSSRSVMQLLNMDDFSMMLRDLQCNDKSMKSHNWMETDLDTFVKMCSNKQEMNRHFQKHEVHICAKSIEKNSKNIKLRIISSWPKYKVLEHLFDMKNEDVDEIIPKKRRRIEVSSLKDLCWKQFAELSKDQLMVLLAENEWKNEYNAWKNNSPVPHGLSITDVADNMQWFTQPRLDDDGIIRFHFTDACYLLTCLRTKLCTTGIQGLERKAWEIAALSKETKLNISVVVDCVDKQDVALARRVFAEDVEKMIEANGFTKEALFCRLIRLWYDAEHEPAISAIERCKRRINLLSWLFEGYPIGQFPPATRYVRGIPIVTYEALVSHLERKLQLHAFVPGSRFNVRATGTQEVEQLFSSFRDMDPSGSGTVKPDCIPGMLASAVEIDNVRLNPDKPFYMRTSNASVYPSHPSSSPEEVQELSGTYIRTKEEAKSLQVISPIDHAFDSETRGRRSHSRPSGLISEPGFSAHGERGVRQYHRRDDSKILAHRRLGFMDLPDSV